MTMKEEKRNKEERKKRNNKEKEMKDKGKGKVVRRMGSFSGLAHFTRSPPIISLSVPILTFIGE